MYESGSTRRYTLDKIAFLGLFIGSLLLAQLVVVLKSAVRLSQPISLPYSGLSVSVPAGSGWQSYKNWRYGRGGFALNSSRATGQGDRQVLVQWRYSLVAGKHLVEEQFDELAGQIDAKVVERGQYKAGELVVEWAKIEEPETSSVLMAGIADLPDDRGLEIEVFEPAGNGLAGRLLEQMVRSIHFADNGLVHRGAQFMAQIRADGLGAALAASRPTDGNSQDIFLVKDADGGVIGFVMDVLVDTGADEPMNIRGASYHYLRHLSGEQVMLLQSDNQLEQFEWKSETKSRLGGSGTRIVGDFNSIAVTRFDRDNEERVHPIGPAAIPEILVELVIRKMLDTECKELIVDVINADGTIAPMVLREGRPADGFPLAVESRILDGRDYSFIAYYDSQKQLTKVLLRREDNLVLERTNAPTVMRLFPEQADRVHRGDSYLQQDDDM